ncbi:MAG: L-threonylcarbamoyladenylate synthase [Coriobacteriia bacterium]|nr:L-threonylcarbamoyladenylate synthase [Coriobacteriia bacterium]
MEQSARVEQAVEALRSGRAVIFPTDTVYGLGVSVEHAPSPQELFDLKHRDAGKPIAWLVGSLEDLDVYGANVPDAARAAAREQWPGALTLIVRASDRVPAAFASARGTIGLRMPGNPTALELIRRVGCPLATTSANASGQPAPYEVAEIAPDLAASVGCVLADDLPKSGVASTILDCTGAEPVVLRQG